MANTLASPHLTPIQPGDAVVIEVGITDCGGAHDAHLSGDEPVMDPSGGVFLTLFDPDHVEVFTHQAMTRVDPGLYRLTFQTGESWAPGLYDADVLCWHGARPHRSAFYGVFRLLDGGL